MEGVPETSTHTEEYHNELEQRTTKLERLKEVVKPIWKYGLLTLLSLKSLNVEAQEQHHYESHDHQHYEYVEGGGDNNEGESENALFIEGEEGFNYYHQNLLEDFDTFYEYAKDDDRFLNQVILEGYKILHSEEMLSYLNQKLISLRDSGLEGTVDYESLKDEIDNFTVFDNSNEEQAKEAILSEQYEKLKRNADIIKHQKQWLEKIIGSDAYLQRLIIETEGDESKAKELQEARLQRLHDYNFYLSNDPIASLENALGHVDNTYNVFLGNSVAIIPGKTKTPIHEFDHQHLIGLMTDYAKGVYSTLSADNIEKYQFDNPQYYFNPIELAARKRVLDYELEKMGIKTYEEAFTDEHYQKIQELLEEGALDRNSKEFFNSFSRDSVMVIMNTIAENIDHSPLHSSESVA